MQSSGRNCSPLPSDLVLWRGFFSGGVFFHRPAIQKFSPEQMCSDSGSFAFFKGDSRLAMHQFRIMRSPVFSDPDPEGPLQKVVPSQRLVLRKS